MKKIILLFLVFLVGCSKESNSYKTYLQVDPSTEENHLSVLTLVDNLNDEDDTAIAIFTIEPGEELSKSVGSKLLPGQLYKFKTSVQESANGNVAIIVWVVVKSPKGSTLYENHLQIHGYGNL